MEKRILKEKLLIGISGSILLFSIIALAFQRSEQEESPKVERTEVKEEFVTSQAIMPTAEVTNLLQCTVDEPSEVSLGEFRITAYCACEKCCPGTSDGITYTETIATEGRTIAVDPDVIPLGSLVEIAGNTYIAEDIGGVIKGNKLDLFFNSHKDALEWGVQYYEVYLVN